MIVNLKFYLLIKTTLFEYCLWKTNSLRITNFYNRCPHEYHLSNMKFYQNASCNYKVIPILAIVKLF